MDYARLKGPALIDLCSNFHKMNLSTNALMLQTKPAIESIRLIFKDRFHQKHFIPTPTDASKTQHL